MLARFRDFLQNLRIMNITNNQNNSIVLYARISKVKHTAKELSLDNQISLGEKWAKANGFNVIGIFREVASAKKTSTRPQFLEAVKLVKKEKATLFLYQLSRGFRSTLNSIEISDEINKAGGNLVSYSEDINSNSPSGKLYFTIISAMAQFEREIIGLRTKDALAHKKATGAKLGGTVPYGFRLIKVTGKLAKIKKEQEVISRLLYYRKEGWSYRKIAEMLNSENIPSKTGKEWYANTVRKIILEAEKRLKITEKAGI